jgi:hypothetical protein
MRRIAFVAFAFILPVPVALLAYGCDAKAPTIQDFCGFLGSPDNCYLTLVRDMGARCGTPGSADPATPSGEWAPNDTVQGYFVKRDKLDMCILNKGGAIVFEESLDLEAFPLSGITFTVKDAVGQVCGAFSFTSEYNFSINVSAATAEDGGVLSDAGPECAKSDGGEKSPDATDNPGGDPAICGGNFISMTSEGKFVDTTCAKEEHHFISSQLEQEACAKQKELLPRYQLETVAGGVFVPGHVRLRVFYPELGQGSNDGEGAPDGNAPDGGADSFAVTYFDCVIPPALKGCCNGEKDGSETDKDCGGPTKDAIGAGACNRCQEGQGCISKSDCLVGAACIVDMNGITKCGDGGTAESENVCDPPDADGGGAGDAGDAGGAGDAGDAGDAGGN